MVQVRQQTQTSLVRERLIDKPYNNAWNCIKTIMREEGKRALWKGNLTHILSAHGIGLMNIIYFKARDINNIQEARDKGLFWIMIMAHTMLYPMEVVRVKLINNVDIPWRWRK